MFSFKYLRWKKGIWKFKISNREFSMNYWLVAWQIFGKQQNVRPLIPIPPHILSSTRATFHFSAKHPSVFVLVQARTFSRLRLKHRDWILNQSSKRCLLWLITSKTLDDIQCFISLLQKFWNLNAESNPKLTSFASYRRMINNHGCIGKKTPLVSVVPYKIRKKFWYKSILCLFNQISILLDFETCIFCMVVSSAYLVPPVVPTK